MGLSAQAAFCRFGLAPAGQEVLLESELEPDLSGKIHLVHTVPQSGEASDILAASLGSKAGDAGLVKALGEANVEEKATGSTEKKCSPSALSWLHFRSLRALSEPFSAGKTPLIKSKQLVGASSQSWAPWCSWKASWWW